VTTRVLFALAQRLLVGVVLVVSGGYLIIYLYRWEWNRAIISGLVFVAAEVAMASAMILRRLQALERGDASARPTSPQRLVLERLRATPLDRPNPFAWLSPRRGRTTVFVPVLLGAGAVLSAIAYVVERIAEATALPAFDRRLASRLSALSPPTGGLLGSPTPTPPPASAAPGVRRRPSVAAAVLAFGAVAVLGWLGIATLLDATQSRPDPADRPARTTIELSVAQRRAPQAAALAAEALWVECRSTLGSLDTTARVIALGGDRVTLVLEPGIGRLATRRLTGCLVDLRVNLVRADILDVESRG
jgi:hypothetical protein